MTAPRPQRRIFDTGFWVLAGLAAVGCALVLARDGWRAAWTIVAADLALLAAVAPKVAAGVLIGAALPQFLRAEALNAWVGPERGWRGLALAAAAGAATPGGPAVALPMAAGLLASGTDRGAAGAFVTGWVLLSVNRTLVWELTFLPGETVLTRVLVCLPAPLIVGWALRRAA